MGRTTGATRLIAAAAVGAAIAAALTGCTGAATSPAPDGHQDWTDRMSALLNDPNGAGGASGDLDGSPTFVFLAGRITGNWDVLEVCTGTDRVHVTVRALTSQPHGQFSPGATLGSGDVVCGATLRIPITADDAAGVDLTAHENTPSAQGQWSAQIVRRGWQPGVS